MGSTIFIHRGPSRPLREAFCLYPTTDGRTLIFSRYTMRDKLQRLLLAQLEFQLPQQSPPRITSKRSLEEFPP